MKEKDDILICECSSTEHQIVIRTFDDGLVYLSVHLNKEYNFCQRLILGIKYIFGYKCKYGHWEEFILSNKHKEKLQTIIKQVR